MFASIWCHLGHHSETMMTTSTRTPLFFSAFLLLWLVHQIKACTAFTTASTRNCRSVESSAGTITARRRMAASSTSSSSSSSSGTTTTTSDRRTPASDDELMLLGNSTDEETRRRYPGVHVEQVNLSTGISAQVLYSSKPSDSNNNSNNKQQPRPPLVFIHGSFHAGWCWCEHWFEYFTSLGYPTIALSLRGTGSSFAGEGVKKVRIDQHAQDVRAFLNEAVPKLLPRQQQQHDDGSSQQSPPILISHSFGGLAVMKLLEQNPEQADRLAGIVTMCSVPPSGNGPMTMRFLRRSLRNSYKITVGFAMKKCIQNAGLARDLFFGGDKVVRKDGTTIEDYGVSDEDLSRFQTYFQRDTEAVIDIRDLLKHLPSKMAVDGRAPHLSEFPPCLVIGASRDFIVDREGVDETAKYFGLEEPVIVDSPHDVMLGRNWKNGADAILRWIDSTVMSKDG